MLVQIAEDANPKTLDAAGHAPVVGWSPDRPTSGKRKCVTYRLVRLADAWAGRETTAVNIFEVGKTPVLSWFR